MDTETAISIAYQGFIPRNGNRMHILRRKRLSRFDVRRWVLRVCFRSRIPKRLPLRRGPRVGLATIHYQDRRRTSGALFRWYQYVHIPYSFFPIPKESTRSSRSIAGDRWSRGGVYTRKFRLHWSGGFWIEGSGETVGWRRFGEVLRIDSGANTSPSRLKDCIGYTRCFALV